MNKNIKLTNLLLIGLFIISLGIIIIVVNVSFYELIIFIFSVFIIINALYNIINYFLKHKKLNLINSIINIILGYLMLIIPKIPLSVLPIIFAIYIIFNGIVKMVNAYQMYKNKVKGKWSEGGSALVYIVFGIILLFSPLIHIRIVLNIIGIYLVLYGLSFIGDFISTIIPTKTKKNLKRKVRITLPVFIAAFVPHKVLKELNEFLQDSKEYTYLKTDKEVKSDIEILIHVNDKGFGKIGHCDFFFENKIYSYGNYDSDSKSFFDMLGDGVLFKTNKEKYISLCIENDQKTIFGFGIKLNNVQKQAIKEKIKELESITYRWYSNYENSINDKSILQKDYVDYASKLSKKTKATLYKFTKGKFKTYFVLGSNCVYLVDNIIGSAWIDILKMNGIITQGIINNNIVANSSVTATYDVGGLIGRSSDNIVIGTIKNNILVVNVEGDSTTSMIVGNNNGYEDNTINSKIYEKNLLNNEQIEDSSNNITRSDLASSTLYSDLAFSSNFDLNTLTDGNYPTVKTITNPSLIKLPTATRLMALAFNRSIHLMPSINVYASGVDTINIEFSKIDNATSFTINNNTTTVEKRIYTYKYNYIDDFTITLNDSINSNTFTYKATDLVNNITTLDNNYYYNDNGSIITNNEEINYNVINIYKNKMLLANNKIYNIKTKELINDSFTNLEEVTNTPLYTFNYGGSLINTYYNFSLIDNAIVDKQLFYKNSNIEMIDSTLDNKKNYLILDNYNNKSQVIYLGSDGILYNLKDEVEFPDNFKNSNIKAISSNVDNNSPLLFVEYKDGNYICFNYKTKEVLELNNSEKENITTYFLASFRRSILRSNTTTLTSNYDEAKTLITKVEEEPLSKVLDKTNSSVSKNDYNYITSYNPVKKKYEVYEVNSYISNKVIIEKQVTSKQSVNDIINNNEVLFNYYYQDNSKDGKTTSWILIFISILVMIIISIVLLDNNIKKNTLTK